MKGATFLAMVVALGALLAGRSALAQCPATAQPPEICRSGQRNHLIVKNEPGGVHDTLVWKYTQGLPTTVEELGSPQTTTQYALCIYTGPSGTLVGEIQIPPSTKWKAAGGSFKYRDKTSAADGARKLTARSGGDLKSSASFEGGGDGLPDILDAGPLSLPVIVQLMNSDTGACFHTRFELPWRNDGARFFARQ